MKRFQNTALSIVLIVLMVFSSPIKAYATDSDSGICIHANEYSDISGSWFEQWAKIYGYQEIFSNGDGLFHPDKPVTRMEFVRMLHKALGISIKYFAPTDIAEYFNDVKSSDAGANELYDLVTCGIIDTKVSFSPSEELSRDEMIHFIINAYEYYVGSDYAVPAIYRFFEDDADIRAEYSTDIQTACAFGLVNGRSGNLLCPRDTATRAEAVTLAGKLVDNLDKMKNGVTVKASASETGGELRLSLSVLNTTDKTVSIAHSSQQLFDFAVYGADDNSLYRWSADRMFAQMVTTTTIEPGKEAVFSAVIDAASYSLFKDKMQKVVGYITGSSTDFKINPDGYRAS